MLRPALTLCALALASTAGAGQYNAIMSIGDPMPSFESLPAIDGSTLSSSALDQDVVVLVSLANHCPWVRGMDGDLVKLVQGLDGRSVRVVAFSVNHREEDRLPAMKEHAGKAGYNFTYVYDDSQELGRDLGATHTPEYFVFDKARKLVYTGALYDSPAKMGSDGKPHYMNGEPRVHYVRDAIDATLAGQPVKVAETSAPGCTVEYER
jgi:hypothetical protein